MRQALIYVLKSHVTINNNNSCTFDLFTPCAKSGEIYVSGEEPSNESRDTDCTPLCPRCNHDTDIAASLLGNQQDAAWIGVAKTCR